MNDVSEGSSLPGGVIFSPLRPFLSLSFPRARADFCRLRLREKQVQKTRKP
jgi:hypothetical protein